LSVPAQLGGNKRKRLSLLQACFREEIETKARRVGNDSMCQHARTRESPDRFYGRTFRIKRTRKSQRRKPRNEPEGFTLWDINLKPETNVPVAAKNMSGQRHQAQWYSRAFTRDSVFKTRYC
jgi:hypothetical protein